MTRCARCGSGLVYREPDHSGDVGCAWCGFVAYARRLTQAQGERARATQSDPGISRARWAWPPPERGERGQEVVSASGRI